MPKRETLYSLFPEQSTKSIDLLVDDNDFKRILPSLILKKVSEMREGVLPIDSEIILLLFSRASFADEEESMKLASFFKRYIHFEGRFLPLAIDFLEKISSLERERGFYKGYKELGEDFASRCLFSLSFFYDALNRLYKRYGAPHPEFYREMGKRTFESIGEELIAEHFEKWEDFLREEAFN
ncbi:MAG: hypothetical protein QXX68_00980 [Candidatus Pacearchaeota archaeon]